MRKLRQNEHTQTEAGICKLCCHTTGTSNCIPVMQLLPITKTHTAAAERRTASLTSSTLTTGGHMAQTIVTIEPGARSFCFPFSVEHRVAARVRAPVKWTTAGRQRRYRACVENRNIPIHTHSSSSCGV